MPRFTMISAGSVKITAIAGVYSDMNMVIIREAMYFLGGYWSDSG